MKKRVLGLGLAAWGFATLVAVSLVTGYVGLYRFVHAHPSDSYDDRVIDLLYYDLQLFVLGSDPLQGTSFALPVALHVARLAAPAATIYALAGTAWLVFAANWAKRRRRRRRGHSVVVGTTHIATAIIANLRQQKKVVEHDPLGTAQSLADAGIAGADVLYACVDDSADGAANVAVALAAKATPRARHLAIYAHVSDPMLRVSLRARRLGLHRDDILHLDFFNVEELAAHRLMKDEPVAGARHVLVAGLGVFGQAVLVELARQRQAVMPAGSPPLDVTLVDENAPEIAAMLSARCPTITSTCNLLPLTVMPIDESSAGLPCPDRVYVCYEDENHALKTALSISYLWHVSKRALVVRLNRLAHHSEAFHRREAAARMSQWKLLDDLSERLRLIGVTDLGCHTVSIHEDIVELIARTIHDNYYATQLKAGESGPAVVPWEKLSPDKRQANLEQAGHIGEKLSMIHATVAPLTGVAESFAFSADEVELLAREEHKRWVSEREGQGFRYGPERDDAAKIHNSMIPFDDLTQSEQQKDIDAVRGIPGLLADVGLRIVRL